MSMIIGNGILIFIASASLTLGFIFFAIFFACFLAPSKIRTETVETGWTRSGRSFRMLMTLMLGFFMGSSLYWVLESHKVMKITPDAMMICTTGSPVLEPLEQFRNGEASQ